MLNKPLRIALILAPLALIGGGIAWLYHPAAGMVAVGLLAWIDFNRKPKT